MSVTITPSVPALYPTSFTCPADGDLANAASVNGAFQSIMDGVDIARRVLWGSRLRPRYHCAFPNNGPPPNGPLLVVKPLGQIFLTLTGSWITYNINTALSVNLVNANGGNPLTAKTRYYLYFTTVAGVVDAIVSLNPPGDDLRYENGNTDRLYVATFLTSAIASNVWTFTQNNEYLYDTAFQALTTGQASADTGFDPYTTADGPVVPSWARTLRLKVRAVNNAGAADTLTLSALSGLGGGPQINVPANSTVTQEVTLNCSAGSGGQIFYKWATGGVNTGANVYVYGWGETT